MDGVQSPLNNREESNGPFPKKDVMFSSFFNFFNLR